MTMWNDLNIKEKQAFIKVAVANGIRDRATIEKHYNEFAKGGKEEVINFSMPTAGFTATSSDAPVAVKPDAVPVKKKLNIVPTTHINLTGNKDVDNSFSDTVAYHKGDVVTQRLRRMYGLQTDADAKLQHMQRYDKSFQNNPSRMHVTYDAPSNSQGTEVYLNPSQELTPIGSAMKHEYEGHSMYPNAKEERGKFSDEYRSYFDSFRVTPEVVGKIYQGMPNIEGEMEHDLNADERIPFIKEVQGTMKTSINPSTGQPYWDYTTGDKLDVKTYQEFLKNNPKARTQYWDDDKATWLLNNTASIFREMPKDVNYAANGGGLNSPFSHAPIPAVRTARAKYAGHALLDLGVNTYQNNK